MVVFKYVVDFGHISDLLAVDTTFNGSLCGSFAHCGMTELALHALQSCQTHLHSSRMLIPMVNTLEEKKKETLCI